MLIARSKQADQSRLLARQYNKALVFSRDALCAESIDAAIRSLLKLVCIATNNGELRCALNQHDSFQLVIIDADSIESL